MMTRTLLGLLLTLPCIAQAADSKLEGDSNVRVCNEDNKPLTVTASPTSTSPGGRVTLSWEGSDESAYTVTDLGAVTGKNAVVTAPATVGQKTYTVTSKTECGQASGTVTITVKKNKVWLEGSRYCGAGSGCVPDWTIWQYMDYTLNPSGDYPEGASVHAMIDAANIPQSEKDAYHSFCSEALAWPQSADVFHQSHVAGQTHIIDEDGHVVGSVDTAALFANGLPGLNYLGNPWGNGDYNKVFVGDASLNYGGVDYEVEGFVSVSPIILDLDNDGKPDVDRGEWLPHPTRFNRSRSVLFDINADGFPDVTEWIGPKDGLLVAPMPAGQKGVKGGDLFGNPIGFIDGYQKLGMRFDKDQNGKLEGAELEGLMVWQDVNGDGRSQPSELRSVQSLGITSISTQHTRLKSTFVMNGKERATWDWWPTCMLVYPKPLARVPTAGARKL